ncbi:MAG: hypothetical protein ACYC18_02490 [Gammaproteobacteria bacterium]|nr:hypothetical protein [Gammaproteobacteria bacterium]
MIAGTNKPIRISSAELLTFICPSGVQGIETRDDDIARSSKEWEWK